ncbi:DNA adenine methylase [Spiroplasma apis]|uniref:Site-specific DNA-methyltransferase (adenine-specific) n=1 Tax=Spiroplasma apis B31 TaxID=1276258 RepID=V5RKE5_SPIAP|nr:Dam family site-specific DNA-(adenine-N6)-methyltransferase [Spiroplasma apis]AHB36280.1 DNA adenine methylase [Spiroplasma apis B31]
MKPIVKWVGGKTQLLNDIKQRLPEKFNRYIELFVGGGAVFLNLQYEKTIINDLNSELINMYECIRDNYIEVIKYIEIFRIKYNSNPRKFYYELRSLEKYQNDFERAARTIFLNKTCFNGLYRQNKNHKFNVPWNQKTIAPNIYELDNLEEISTFLKSVKILNLDFKDTLNLVKKNDFVYIDPPYDKLNNNTFANYSGNDFLRFQQEELKIFCDEISKKGAFFMVSNHNTEFIKDLYKEYSIDVVMAKRNVNSNGQKRGKIEEVLITNYRK